MKDVIYNNFDFKVVNKEFSYPQKNSKKRVVGITYIEHKDTAVCLYQNANKEYLLLNQYRPIFNDWFLEVPGGLIEKNENPEIAVKREFLEETGYEIKVLKKLSTIIPSIGLSTEKIHIFFAKEIQQKMLPNLNADELMKIEWTSFSKIMEMVNNGKIIDGKTISAILLHSNLYQKI